MACGAEGLGALRAGEDAAKVVVAVDARGVGVVETELDGVVADDGGGGCAGLGLEHGERGGGGGARGGEFLLFYSFVVAGGAGAFFAEIGKIVVAGVAVGPGDVHAGAAGDVDLDAGGFFALIEGERHFRISPLTVYGCEEEKDNAETVRTPRIRRQEQCRN